jgi:hypothetical protein
MMKSNRVKLADWEDHSNSLDIDWPMVHRLAGLDLISWAMSQPRDHCQMMIDKTGEKRYSLFLEFYNHATLKNYSSKWAK